MRWRKRVRVATGDLPEPRPDVGQTLTTQGPTYAVAKGSQYHFAFTISDESAGRLLPEVTRLLSGLPDWGALIREVAGDAQLPDGLDLKGLLLWLAELLIADGQIPRPLLASELASQRVSDPAFREALRAVADQWAAEVPGGRRILNKVRESAEADSPNHAGPCVLIILDPDRNGGAGYRLSLILFRNGQDGDPQPSDDGLLSIDDVRDRLRECLPPLVQTLNRSSLLLEFAVPRNLLNVDFDQWSIPEGTGSNSSRSYLLGVRYAVVVRDLERMSPIDDRSWWRARWQCLCDSGSQVADGVRWVSLTADHSYDSLTAELLREHARKQVCLALASAPVTDTLSAELLEAGLTAGMPAAIWLRQVGTDSQAADGHYLGLAVKSGVLGRLPLTVLDLRQEAEAKRRDADHQGRRLSLLWDDPDRTWKPPPFNMPHLSLNGADE